MLHSFKICVLTMTEGRIKLLIKDFRCFHKRFYTWQINWVDWCMLHFETLNYIHLLLLYYSVLCMFLFLVKWELRLILCNLLLWDWNNQYLRINLKENRILYLMQGWNLREDWFSKDNLKVRLQNQNLILKEMLYLRLE